MSQPEEVELHQLNDLTGLSIPLSDNEKLVWMGAIHPLFGELAESEMQGVTLQTVPDLLVIHTNALSSTGAARRAFSTPLTEPLEALIEVASESTEDRRLIALFSDVFAWNELGAVTAAGMKALHQHCTSRSDYYGSYEIQS